KHFARRLAHANEAAPNLPSTATNPAHEPQRHHSGRWPWNAPLPAHAGNLETAVADLRQAPDLLLADDADDGGLARDLDHHDPRGNRPVQAPARRRTAMGDRAFVRDPGPSRRHRGSVPDRPRI